VSAPTGERRLGLSKRERLLILIGLCAAVVVAVFGLTPPAPAGRSAVAERQRARKVQAELAAARAEVTALEEDVAARLTEGDPRSLGREMIEWSQAAARAAGIRIDDLKPAQVESAAGLRRVPVQVTVAAPFPQVVRFLYELDRKQDRFRVDQLRMGASGGPGDRISIDLRLVAYVKEEESDAGS
jgi:hypothetical protein